MEDDQRSKAKLRFSEWERYAQEDEQIAEIALKEDGPPNQICLHAQQMAEKYLKGFLAFHKNPPIKTHQLDQLLDSCKKFDPSFSKLQEEALELNEYYIETRYPGDIPEFNFNEAQKAFETAQKIRDFVLERIN